MSPPPPTWQPPTDFEEYHLLEPLGRGAMGEVYLARDQLLDRLVAVKFISGVAPLEGQRERFRNEARAIARVQHPNVVAIYRVGEVLRRPYLVSEFVRGQSLDRLPLPLPWTRVLGLGIGLARGLAAAHRRGVVHRDLKPANAMLSEEGDVKLLDFGVARLIDAAGGLAGQPRSEAPGPPLPTGSASSADLVRTATLPPSTRKPEAPSGPAPARAAVTGLVGTPAYIAPEIWRGEPASPRSDVYSLGVLLHELCSGSPPHAASSLEALRQAVLHGPCRPLASVAPGVEPALAAVIDRCLSPEPASRFASADALREALEALRERTAAQAPSLGRPYPGLHAFSAEDRATFSGRAAETRALLDRLRAEALVLVAGDSGVGKSSLCRAGVLPRVAEDALGTGPWTACELLPGRRPLEALAAALAPLLGGGESTLLHTLREAPAELGRRVRAGLGARGLLVLADQLEELLTLAPPEDAERFALALESLTTGGPRLRVLATARGDFLARLASLPGLGEVLSGGGLYLLQPPGLEGLREAIVAPARARGFAFESEALVETLVAAGGSGGLPLLQFALAELWERREPGRGVIPVAALVALGGVDGALARHADGVVSTLPPVERSAARGLLSRLVTAEGTRARRTRAELLGGAGREEPPARAALEALVRGRLVVAREAPGGEADAGTYELAHEALLTGWDTLRGWLAGDAEQRALRQRLERASAEWQRLARARELLWRGPQLAEVARLDTRALSDTERAFLRESRGGVRRRRLGRVAAVLSLPLLTGAVYGGVQLQALHARERKLEEAVAAAQRTVALAREEHQRAQALRREAFAAFDAARKQEGEAAWARAVALTGKVERTYGEASAALDAALRGNLGHAGVRRRFAEVLFERIQLAESLRRPALRDELLQRLASVDDTGELRRRLLAPARLDLETGPAGATVRVERALEEEGGQRRWSPPGTLGTTPLEGVELPPGSYRLTFQLPDRPPVHYPVLLERGEHHPVRLALPAAVPDGFVYVPPGRFLYGSGDEETIRRSLVRAQPLHALTTDGYLIGRTEVTHAEWLAFLRTLPPGERAERRPNATNYYGSLSVTEREPGRWEFRLERKGHVYLAREGEPVHYRERERRAVQDWLRFPVSGVSWEDAQAYVTWLDATGRVRGARLCDEREWERAARGADGRSYPHGDSLEPDDANFDATYGRKSLAFGPDEVGSHPASDSPFGLRDASGNVWEWMRSVTSPGMPAYGGGSFYQDQFTARILQHGDGEPRLRSPFIGLRVCAPAPAP